MPRRTALHNAAFTMAGQLVARLVGLVFYAVLARALGPERYGHQGFGAAVGTLCVVFLEPGLNALLIRDGARDRSLLEERLAETLGYKLVLLAAVWPIAVAITWAAGYEEAALTAVLFAGGTVLLGAFEDVAAAALTAMERLDLEGFLRVISKVLVAGAGLGAIAAGADFAGVLGAICAGAMLTAVAGLWLVFRAGIVVRILIRPAVMAKRVATSWPLALAGILWLVTLRLDQVLCSALGVRHDDIGEYNAAVKLVEAIVLFPGAVATAFQPIFARSFLDGAEACSRQLRSAMGASLALAIPVATGGALLAPRIVTLVYGSEFAASGQLLAVQVWTLPLVAIQFLATHALVAAGAVRSQALAVGANLVVNVIVNLALVRHFGMLGASYAALSGGLSACAVFWATLSRAGLRPSLLSGAWRPGAAAGVMALALWGVGDRVPVLVAIAAGALVYAAVFFAVGGRSAVRALLEARRGESAA